MTPDSAQAMVIGSLAAAGAVVAANAISEGHAPELRQVVGFSFVAVGLGTTAMFAPDLAASMSVLILTTAVFVYGKPALDAIAGVTTTTPTKNKKNPGRTASV